MHRITFECEVITPMFIAGADSRTPELRPPSIKGAMRFWWRAVNGHLVTRSDDGTWDYSELKRREAEIFGSQERRSAIDIIIENSEGNNVSDAMLEGKKFDYKGKKLDILHYLTYGSVIHYNKFIKSYELIRQYFDVNSNFSLVIKFNNNRIDENKIQILKEIVYLMSVIGGLGSKSRNGFGRFKVNEIKVDGKSQEVNLNFEELIEKYKKNFNYYPIYTAFSKYTEFVSINSSFSTWNEALSELGLRYRQARLYLENYHQYNERKYIAAPLIVNKKNIALVNRHPKSLFFYIEKQEQAYKAGFLYLPYFYLFGHKRFNDDRFKNYINAYEQLISNLKN